jgi:cell division protein FtsX
MAVGLMLLLSGFLFWIQQGLKPVMTRLRYEQVITAFLDPSVESKDEAHVVDSVRDVIRTTVGSQATADIGYVDAKKAIDSIRADHPDLGRELEGLGSEADTVVPRYVTVAGIFPDSIVDSIREIQGIESADSSKDRYKHVVAAFSALRWVAKVLVVGLCLALLTGLIHLSRMNSYIHQDAVALMKLWGGSDFLLRTPSLLSGVLVGCLGGGLAGMGWLIAGKWFARHIRALSPMLKDMATLPLYFPLMLLAAGALLGLLAGLLGSAQTGVPGAASASDRRA